ncbi:MAG: hypothetical protein AM326_03400 [Candidatus Thorarchaeota archaeon SMTZ-45]|jgi:hypothetical protein|nr:MAG: hypothetical protein AM326_03400 [Candidatus Thorarchaeota archaeon SMTZ-45]
MASGVNRVVVGAVVGTGSAMNIDTVGFRPKLVRVVNVGATGLSRLEWFKGQADAAAVKTITNGTISVIAANGITPRANGFTLGADANVNISGELAFFEAHE